MIDVAYIFAPIGPCIFAPIWGVYYNFMPPSRDFVIVLNNGVPWGRYLY